MPFTRKKSYHLVYFLLQPFFTTLYYLYNFRKPAAKNVMWLFAVYYGATFAIGVESEGADIVSYISDVPRIHSMGFKPTDFLFYHMSTGEFDILRNFLAFFLSFFTDNGFYLIIIFGLIYGYFYSRNIWYILNLLEGKTKPYTRVLMFCLFLVIPLWSMNGFRFWTGAHVFIYGLLPFLYEKNRKSLIWCFITPFIFHYSFLSAVLPIIGYLVLGSRVRLYYIAFVFSFIFSEVNLDYFNKLVENYAPTSIIEKSEGYRSEEMQERKAEFKETRETVWYARYYKDTAKYVLAIYIFVIYVAYKRRQEEDVELMRLFSFVLLFFAFANIFSSIPSGYRFMKVSNFLTFSFLIVYYQNNKVPQAVTNLTGFAGVFLLLSYFVVLRISWYSFSVMTMFGNPFTAIYTFGENLSFNDVIKNFLK